MHIRCRLTSDYVTKWHIGSVSYIGANLQLAPIGSTSECNTDTDARSSGEFSKLPHCEGANPCPLSNHTSSNPFGNSLLPSCQSERRIIRLAATDLASQTGWSSRSS